MNAATESAPAVGQAPAPADAVERNSRTGATVGCLMTASPDATQVDCRTPIEERLAHEPVVWLSTIRPDGRPHIVPVWFTWDGEAITFFSKPHAQKVRNLQANPNVMLAVGAPDEDMDVELIEGCAEVLTEPAADMAPGRLEKYGALMARVGLTVEQFVQTYSQVVRIRPTRFLGWGGPGWLSTTAAAG